MRGVKGNRLLIGDFNLPDINWETGESSRRTEDFVDALDDLMLTQMVHFATNIKGNCLDLMLTNIFFLPVQCIFIYIYSLIIITIFIKN